MTATTLRTAARRNAAYVQAWIVIVEALGFDHVVTWWLCKPDGVQ